MLLKIRKKNWIFDKKKNLNDYEWYHKDNNWNRIYTNNIVKLFVKIKQ